MIAYALKSTLRNYSPLFQAIKSNSSNWSHYIEDAWVVTTHRSADEFAKLLYPHIDAADRLLVVRLYPEHQGWLPKEAWDWLNRQTY